MTAGIQRMVNLKLNNMKIILYILPLSYFLWVYFWGYLAIEKNKNLPLCVIMAW